MISAAPIGPQNSYEVVRGFNSDFFSTAVEEVIGGGEVEVVCDQAVGSLIGVHQREKRASHSRRTIFRFNFSESLAIVSPTSKRSSLQFCALPRERNCIFSLVDYGELDNSTVPTAGWCVARCGGIAWVAMDQFWTIRVSFLAPD